MIDGQEVWRWHFDPAWHYHCSMVYEGTMARNANNDFMGYHHIRACIYFSVSGFEAFLNGQMRRVLERAGKAEEEILQKLRHTNLDIKRKEWPSTICGKELRFSTNIDHVFEIYRELRNEITHPKRRDHSIYQELDGTKPEELIQAISVAMVTIYEGKSEPFPYWLLGWNYVGMNENAAYPHQSNNMNGFIWSLMGMGFNVPTNDIHWDQQHMVTLDDYWALKSALDQYPMDIEPYWSRFPTRPRLTRRWWDHDFINNSLKQARQETQELQT